jgi:hypothetical protein
MVTQPQAFGRLTRVDVVPRLTTFADTTRPRAVAPVASVRATARTPDLIEIVLPDSTAVRDGRADRSPCFTARAGNVTWMITLPSGVRVWLACGHTGMRRHGRPGDAGPAGAGGGPVQRRVICLQVSFKDFEALPLDGVDPFENALACQCLDRHRPWCRPNRLGCRQAPLADQSMDGIAADRFGNAATRPDCFSSRSGARTCCRGWPGHGLVREAIHGPRLSSKTHDNRGAKLRIRR